MESDKEKIEQIKLAIQKLILEKKNKQLTVADCIDEDDEDDQLLLSRLLSQLDAVKRDGMPDQADSKPQEAATPGVGNSELEEKNALEAEEIVKEIRKVKRQNLITHCLLSAMIILTITWQLSEVSLLLQLKDGVRHPFRSLGSMLKGMLKKPAKNGLDDEKDSSSSYADYENSSLPNLRMPELPRVDIPEFSLNGDKNE